MKTGSGGRPWVVFDSPKPPAVADRYAYWSDPPPSLSPRCRWWLAQVARGWRPNRSWRSEGYDNVSALFGVYIWEYQQIIRPALASQEMCDLG